MSAEPMVHTWRHLVKDTLVPHLHGHQARAVADLSFAMAATGQCQAARLAPAVPGTALLASDRRRLERFVANPRLHARRVQSDLAQAVLTRWTGQRLLLILDETPKGNDLRCLSVRVGYRKRAVPLVSCCYRPHALPKPLPQLVRGLLRQVARCVPPGARVILLADRGLAWPLVVDWCHDHGWHYVLRLLGQTKVRFPTGAEQAVRDLAPQPGRRWLGPAEVFKKAGWRGACVVATWERGVAEPWLLLTDERASLSRCRTYCHRMWIEESFRDDKSMGLHWEKSRVLRPEHAQRLLVLLAVAMVLALLLGTLVLKRGWRHELDPRRTRRYSLFGLGQLWLQNALQHGDDRLRLDYLAFYPSG